MAKHPPLPPADLPDWPVGDPVAPLAPGAVRVWLWSLEAPAVDDEALLAPDERERADRFHFEQDRRHFVAARCGLRRLLARATGRAPDELAFRYHGMGKPSLTEACGGGVWFNLSHSAGAAIAALSVDGEVGADIEAVRPTNWGGGIAERYFSPGEVDELKAEPADRQDQAFFRFWTNKEAVVKLLGSGLGFPLPTFTTPLDAAAGAEVAMPADNPLGLTSCWVRSLPTGTVLQGAVATPGAVATVECFRLPVAPMSE